MTPDERQLISGLFDRMRSNGPVEKDRDAESLINQAVRQTPDAAYLLVQSVLAQEHYLQQAGGRIEELEARMRDLEDEIASSRPRQQAPAGGGSFLGGLFGGGRQAPAPEPMPRRSGSVPAFGSRPAPQARAGSPWGGQQPQQGGMAGGAFGQSPMQQQPAQQGGGFMRSALATAAGVAGGMMAANALSGMLGGGSSASAATGDQATTPATDNSPFAVDNDADRQAQLNAQQDAEQDAELANEQHASYDDNSDWGSADDSEY
jgi:hypothetical protein